MLTCLNCGGGLEPYAGDPDGAPWVCHGCHLGFWVSELSQEARALYRPRFNDFGRFRDTEALRGRCHAERADARARGTSCLPEHIGLLEPAHSASYMSASRCLTRSAADSSAARGLTWALPSVQPRRRPTTALGHRQCPSRAIGRRSVDRHCLGTDDASTFSAPSGWSSLGALMDPGRVGPGVPRRASRRSPGRASRVVQVHVDGRRPEPVGAIVDYTAGRSTTTTRATGSGTAASLAAASVTTTQASEIVVAFGWRRRGSTGISLPVAVTSRASVGYYRAETSTSTRRLHRAGSPGVLRARDRDRSTGTGRRSRSASRPPPQTHQLCSTRPTPHTSTCRRIGGPFKWQYNPNGASGGQTAYHFRRKSSGGSYSYWNAGHLGVPGHGHRQHLDVDADDLRRERVVGRQRLQLVGRLR